VILAALHLGELRLGNLDSLRQLAGKRRSLRPAWPWIIGYAPMAVLFFLAAWVTVEVEGIRH
jgi:hypothetical protein